MINGLIKLMNSNDEITGPVNLGNSFPSTMIELAGSNSSKVFKPLPQDDLTKFKEN